MSQDKDSKSYIFQSFPNSFNYLINDAECLLTLAKSADIVSTFRCTQLCRSSILLYILALEGLINRALDHFLPPRIREFILAREKSFTLLDKWEMLPLFVSDKRFDRSRYPWSHLKELVSMRNDFVHPKHDRAVFYKVSKDRTFDQLDFRALPAGLAYRDRMGKEKKVKESDLVYRQTRISKDPYAYRPEDVETIRKTVDEIVKELDGLLGGKLSSRNWLRSDELKIIYPPGAKISDVLG